MWQVLRVKENDKLYTLGSYKTGIIQFKAQIAPDKFLNSLRRLLSAIFKYIFHLLSTMDTIISEVLNTHIRHEYF